MKILLDECLPHRLRNHLPGHECQTASFAGFGGLENGDLLEAAEKAKFDVLLTADRGIEYQQEFGHRKIAMIILRAKSIELKHLIPLGPFLLAQLDSIKLSGLATMNRCKSRMSEHFLNLWTAAVTSAGEPQEPGLGQATICSNFFSQASDVGSIRNPIGT